MHPTALRVQDPDLLIRQLIGQVTGADRLLGRRSPGPGWESQPAGSGFVSDLTTVALVVIPFRDGLEVEGELLQAHWHLPVRKLVIGMPITAAIVALVAHLAVGLSWVEAFLLAG